MGKMLTKIIVFKGNLPKVMKFLNIKNKHFEKISEKYPARQ